jgi:hypothetical protein
MRKGKRLENRHLAITKAEAMRLFREATGLPLLGITVEVEKWSEVLRSDDPAREVLVCAMPAAVPVPLRDQWRALRRACVDFVRDCIDTADADEAHPTLQDHWKKAIERAKCAANDLDWLLSAAKREDGWLHAGWMLDTFLLRCWSRPSAAAHCGSDDERRRRREEVHTALEEAQGFLANVATYAGDLLTRPAHRPTKEHVRRFARRLHTIRGKRGLLGLQVIGYAMIIFDAVSPVDPSCDAASAVYDAATAKTDARNYLPSSPRIDRLRRPRRRKV